jgi:hypothetical protein
MRHETPVKYTICIPPSLRRKFKIVCAVSGVSMSAAVREMIEQYVRKEAGK